MTTTVTYRQFWDRINPKANIILDSILLKLPAARPNGPWVAGGLFRRVLNGQSLDGGDVDFFFKNEAQYQDFHKEMIDIYNAKIIRDETHVTEYHIDAFWDITPVGTKNHGTIVVQAIKMAYYDNPITLIEDFDYTCCMFAYDGVKLYYGDWSLWDNARKRLVVNKIKYPVASLRRLIKYTNQGYYACQGTLQELANTIHTMDPIDFKKSKITYVD